MMNSPLSFDGCVVLNCRLCCCGDAEPRQPGTIPSFRSSASWPAVKVRRRTWRETVDRASTINSLNRSSPPRWCRESGSAPWPGACSCRWRAGGAASGQRLHGTQPSVSGGGGDEVDEATAGVAPGVCRRRRRCTYPRLRQRRLPFQDLPIRWGHRGFDGILCPNRKPVTCGACLCSDEPRPPARRCPDAPSQPLISRCVVTASKR
jgi:hypothetical protein